MKKLALLIVLTGGYITLTLNRRRVRQEQAWVAADIALDLPVGHHTFRVLRTLPGRCYWCAQRLSATCHTISGGTV